MPRSNNLLAPTASISRAQREARNGHRGTAILLTGLPAAGKSTLAQALHAELFGRGVQSIVLDGDGLRVGLNRDLGFTDSDRLQNIRRASEVAALLVENGQIVILAMIAPLMELREVFARRLGEDYREVWCSASLTVCEQRDPKGHYARARRGDLPGFTGVSAPYEPPLSASLVLDTGVQSVEACLDHLLTWLGGEVLG
ncbi:adenylylsulfate kinase [Pseudomonas frederiksbergensis]|jgi:adenylylsulfate kinase|uniref:Adenylyl-sulfate kinase n=1 Tax=Pseudomonas frederiksbergensis TaxID=104087 RepID=A0A1H4RMV1_9PSED|nr:MULTISPECIES: adenylyl-sulfate kinase [Pseudomonas]PMU11701.1 adenylyl-sulfate kinase [Pseudomonas sp. FW305-20]PMU15411.1 adenylyl-sulfate kinase [Pseudomonas sp. FW305-122]PMU43254.1 adenylyl-sulfate kinase [Pseudomonas sp. FW305-47B]PMX63545.1 adenylyl-sulfate kinase [Pseudomonas sp. FW305-60]PMX64579.1 adenylyl-sulfate kinase [Pseudomonas sp. FW305-33]